MEKSFNIPVLSPSAVLSLTSSNDFLFGYVAWVDFSGKLQDSYIGVLVRVGVDIGLERLQLLWEEKKNKIVACGN